MSASRPAPFDGADSDRRRPPREAAAAGRRKAATGGRSVLVVANRTLAAGPLRAEIARRVGDGAEIHVGAPILSSRIHYVASDIDAELREARARLDVMLAGARDRGMEITARVGDPSVVLGAIEDELRTTAADEVILSTLPRGSSNWLETGLLERLREELDIPVTHTVAEPDDTGTAGPTSRTGRDRPATPDPACRTRPMAPEMTKAPRGIGASSVPPRGFEQRCAWLYRAKSPCLSRVAYRWGPLETARVRRGLSVNLQSNPPVRGGGCCSRFG